jgi:hypothetical protein
LQGTACYMCQQGPSASNPVPVPPSLCCSCPPCRHWPVRMLTPHTWPHKPHVCS